MRNTIARLFRRWSAQSGMPYKQAKRVTEGSPRKVRADIYRVMRSQLAAQKALDELQDNAGDSRHNG